MNGRRFPRLATFAWACALVAGLASSAFAEIVYTMTNASDLQNDWALAGTITLSGTGTDLGSAAITGWAYTVTKGSDSYTYSSNDSNAFVGAFGLLATPTELIVQYQFVDDQNYLELNVQRGSGGLGWATAGGPPSRYYANDFTGGGPSLSFWQQQRRPACGPGAARLGRRAPRWLSARCPVSCSTTRSTTRVRPNRQSTLACPPES